jgi:UDP-perosamine 4-acetyltransferase
MKCVIIGAGGHGKVVLEILQAQKKHQPVGFLDADPSLVGSVVGGLPVLGAINYLGKLKAQKIKGAIIAIGDNRTRRSYSQVLAQHGIDLISAIHPRAIVSPSAKVGRGVVVAAGAVLGTECTVGDLAIINTAAVIDHECVIEEAAHVCPTAALAGRVRIGACAFVGLGAKILPCLTIGAEAVIGAGAVVRVDVASGVTVVGVPAKVVKPAKAA